MFRGCTIALLCAGLSGCLGLSPQPVLRTDRYMLDPVMVVEKAPRLDLTLGVRTLETARPYGVPMAYLTSDNRLRYRDAEEWTEDPGVLLTRALMDAIADTERFADAGDAAEMARPDLILTGILRKFHENQTKTPPTAEIEVSLALREARDQKLIWAGRLMIEVPLRGEGAAGFAEAMNQAVEQVASTAANRIAREEIK